MAKTCADAIKLLKSLVKDKSGILEVDDDYYRALEVAADEHSRNVPIKTVKEYDGNGSLLYPLPDNWKLSISEVRLELEYPVNDTAEQVQFLDKDLFEIYQDDTDAYFIRFRSTEANYFLPQSGEKFRLHYVIPYVADETGFTIPLGHFIPFVKLTACELCKVMATVLSQNASGNIAEGIVQYSPAAKAFSDLADDYRSDYNRVFNPKDGDGLRTKPKFGRFRTSPLHEKRPISAFPRDADGRPNPY